MKQYTTISDATPLVAFVKKGELNILKEIFGEIFLPKAVYEELTRDTKRNQEQSNIIKYNVNQNWLKIYDLKQKTLPNLNLGAGEFEAINSCFELKNPLLLMDEKKGRRIAKSNKIPVIGTIGILISALNKELKTKTELLKNLDQLLENDFYISSRVIAKFYNKIQKN